MKNNFKLTEAQARERVISEILNPSTKVGQAAAAKWLEDHKLILDKAGLPKIAGVIKKNEADYTYFFNVEDYDYFLKMTIGPGIDPYLEPSSSNKLVMVIDSKTLTLDQVAELSGLPRYLLTVDEEPYQDLPELRSFIYKPIIQKYHSLSNVVESFRKKVAPFFEQKLIDFCHREDVEQVSIVLCCKCHHSFLEVADISTDQVSFFHHLNAEVIPEIIPYGPRLKDLRRLYFPLISLEALEADYKNLKKLRLNNIELTDETAKERVTEEILNPKNPSTKSSIEKWLEHHTILDASRLLNIAGVVKEDCQNDYHNPPNYTGYEFFFHVKEYPYFLRMVITRHNIPRLMPIYATQVALVIDSKAFALDQVTELAGLPAQLLKANENGSILYEPVIETYHPFDDVTELFKENLGLFGQKLIDFCNRKDIKITVKFLRSCYYGMLGWPNITSKQISFFHNLNASILLELQIYGPGLEGLRNEKNH